MQVHPTPDVRRHIAFGDLRAPSAMQCGYAATARPGRCSFLKAHVRIGIRVWRLAARHAGRARPSPNQGARSSAGRALRSQCRGREFDPPRVHHPSLMNADEGCPP